MPVIPNGLGKAHEMYMDKIIAISRSIVVTYVNSAKMCLIPNKQTHE